MPESRFTVEPAEMQRLVETLGVIGEQPGGGIIRHVYDPAWAAAREQVAAWMREARLEVREDAVGNLFGRMQGRGPRTILTGSHIDTVRLGGRYDGALGVLSALAALRVLQRSGEQPAKSLEMVALCEEEDSRFHCNFWGTRGMLGLIDASELDSLRDQDGIAIGQAMRQVGLAPDRFREAVRDDLDAFVELHIEQGRILLPMDLRKDALQAAAHVARAMTRIVEDAGRPAVLTNGWWDVQPGAWNIVPGLVHFSVDLRHPHEPTKQRLAKEVQARGQQIAREHGLAITYEVVGDVPPKDMDEQIKRVLQAAADACGHGWKAMVSGAGHDSQVMATRVPTAMLFVPSVEGRSHSAAEFTTPEDAARGATVLAEALYRLAF
jgi:allantoate deiminase